MGKNAIVGQSGGPTSVINASLAGVFESCKNRGADVVYGMCNGVAGLLEERVVDLSTLLTDDLDIELLKRTPSSFLGSCRYKLPDWRDDEAVYKKLFAILEKLNIGYFFYIGGNDPWTPSASWLTTASALAVTFALWVCPRPSITT